MSTPSTSRRRATLALGTALALAAASLTLGISPASAEVIYATVSGHQEFSSGANKVDSWCNEGGIKIAPGGNSYVLPPGTYSQVIVKAGSGKYANTIFAQSGNLPAAGQTVWADTNNNFAFDPGGKGGDKNISHIILCDGTGVTPETTDLTVEKNWEYLGEQPEGFELGNEDAGSLMVSIENDSPERTWTWGQLNDGLIVDASAQVSEGDVPDPADPKGYRCVITGVPTYSVNGSEPVKDSPTFPLQPDTNNVVITNSVTCTRIITETPTTTLTVSKVWAYVTVPDGYTLTADNAGPLNVTVGGTAAPQAWGTPKSGLPVGETAMISEGAVPAPPQPANYTCKITGMPEYSVNEGEFSSTTPSFTLLPTDNTAKVRNTVTCTTPTPPAVIPPVVTPPVVTPPVVTPPVVTPPTVTPPVVAPPAPDVDEADVAAEEDVVEKESAVAGSEDELADTGANLTGGLGALLVLAGVALIAARKFAIK